MQTLGFWNNKGGTGKTSLSFQTICAFASQNPSSRILVIDVCPQANLSELFLGGQEHEGGKNLLVLHGNSGRQSIGGYFQTRLPKPFDNAAIAISSFISHPRDYNSTIPENISLLAGDPLLELQANAISTLANTQIPGTDSWIAVVSWIRNFIASAERDFDYCFIDMNPSFSMYTQIALASCERVVLPVTADDSSRRGIQNAMSLIFGIKLPSEIYAQHNFHTRMTTGNLPLPQIHLIVKNRLTQYIKVAKGYAAVLDGISNDVKSILSGYPDFFTFSTVQDGIEEVKDFQTSGVVAFARGTPFVSMNSGTLSVASQRVKVNKDQLDENRKIVDSLAKRLW